MTEINTAADPDQTEERCWCCGNEFSAEDLFRLGSHPEVGVCAGCAKWLWRRARHSQDEGRGGVAPTVRKLVFRTRGRIISAGLHNWPVIGRGLRWIDRKLP